MSTREFLRKLRNWARKRNIEFRENRRESKGSHRRIYVGKRNTTVPWTDNLTTGVVRNILKQLEIDDFL